MNFYTEIEKRVIQEFLDNDGKLRIRYSVDRSIMKDYDQEFYKAFLRLKKRGVVKSTFHTGRGNGFYELKYIEDI